MGLVAVLKSPPAVFIDLDDTLTDRTEAFSRWVIDFLEFHDLPPDLRPRLVEYDDQGRRPREEFFAGLPGLLDVEIDARSELAAYRVATASPPAAEGVEAGLAELQGVGATLVVLSNGISAVQHAKLNSTGLIKWFDHIVVSDQVGYRKPQPEIFQFARRLVSPDLDCWMVGDHPVYDIQGAKAAGFSAAWVSHGNERVEATAHADYVACTTRQCLAEIARRYSS